MFGPLKMQDTGFSVVPANMRRLAEAFPKDPVTGVDNKLIDVSKTPGNDSGGVGGVSTAGEFMWAGYAGTFYWAEPKEQICAV